MSSRDLVSHWNTFNHPFATRFSYSSQATSCANTKIQDAAHRLLTAPMLLATPLSTTLRLSGGGPTASALATDQSKALHALGTTSAGRWATCAALMRRASTTS